MSESTSHPMQTFAARYLQEHYPSCCAVMKKNYCPYCLKHGKGEMIRIEKKDRWLNGKWGSGDKSEIWEQIFDDGINPCQALTYNAFSQNPQYTYGQLHYMGLYSTHHIGERCKNKMVCDLRCPLCFKHVPEPAAVEVDTMPGLKCHRFCCVKCPVPGCESLVPALPPSILPKSEEGLEINVCAKHGKERVDSALIPVVPFEPVVSNEVKIILKRACDVKHHTVFKPVAVLSKISVVDTKDGKHKDISTWLKNSSKTSFSSDDKKVKKVFKSSVKMEIDGPAAPTILPAELLAPLHRAAPGKFDFSPPQASLGSSKKDD